jgi:ferric-dicitrate binding protein FerR (iron transport regulator)
MATYLGVRFFGPALAAAAAIVLMVGLTWRSPAPEPGTVDATTGTASWEVAAIVGTPRVGSRVLMGEGRIAVGQTVTTDAGSRAKLEVGDIGQVTVDELTRVRLVETRDGRHRLALERGTLHAAIAAPPGQFIVSTPSATATDLGCVYSLHVNDDGSGLLSVEAGWVAFEERGRSRSCRRALRREPIASTVRGRRGSTTPNRRFALRWTTCMPAAIRRVRPRRCASCSPTPAGATR